MSSKPKFLLIGWDAADWKVVNPLLDAGKMPNLQKLVDQGVIGNLATLKPTYSPMLWTSIATGKRSFKHGINGFYEPTPLGDSVRPISSFSRKTRAFWNMMTLANKRSIVNGWWPSHPVEPINGVMVSNLYQRADHAFEDPWPEKPDLVHPQHMQKKMEDLRLHPQELNPYLMRLFVPNLDKIDQEKDQRIGSIAKITADVTNLTVATEVLLDKTDWDVAAVYLDGIDHYSHGFMCYHPPKLKNIDDYLYKNYNNVVEAGYLYHDFLLGKLLAVIPEDTYVMIVSDHGFHSDHLRPNHIPNEPAGPAIEHRDVGFFCFKGPGIKADQRIYGASLLDVTPTLLYSMNLPVGLDMDGKPLVNAFEKPHQIQTIPSWDEVEGEDGSHPEEMRLNSQESTESLKQLVELGYIEEQGKDMQQNVLRSKRELDFNLAQSYMDAHYYLDALRILNELLEHHCDELRYYQLKTRALLAIQKTDEAEQCLRTLFDQKKKNNLNAKKKLKAIRKVHGEEIKKYKPKIRKKYAEIESESRWNHTAAKLMMATVLQNQEKYEESIKFFKLASKGFKDDPAFLCSFAKAFFYAGLYKKAIFRYNRALKLDPENIPSLVGKAQVFLEQGRYDECTDFALEAIGLQFELPFAHFLLGESLKRLHDYKNAEGAFKMALKQAPFFIYAHESMVDIYSNHLVDTKKVSYHVKQIEKAKAHRVRLSENSVDEVIDIHQQSQRSMSSDQLVVKEKSKPLLQSAFMQNENKIESLNKGSMIVIVSGLPRSGTSMIMQMLQAGGIPCLSDGVREADESNPKGYYELEAIKTLKKDKSFFEKASGHCLKIIAQLLVFIPKKYAEQYRVIMVHRDMKEVMQSQNKMIQRDSKKKSLLNEEQLSNSFRKQMYLCEKFIESTGVPALHLPYHRCIEEPMKYCKIIREFLGEGVDAEAMAKHIDPSLYRNRNTDD